MSESAILLHDRSFLNERHRLSHQQIDQLFHENRSMEFLEDKLRLLDTVQHFLAVTDLLRKSEIPFVCLKGPLLSHRIYGDPAVRISHDIDLLLAPENFEACLKVLLENGYRFSEYYHWPKEKHRQKWLMKADHHLGLQQEKTSLFVEIHWTLQNTLPFSQKEYTSLIAGNLTGYTFAGRSFTVFRKEFELIYLMMHGSKHGWTRLKWLMDIRDYPVQELDGNLFLQLMHRLKAERVVGQTNLLLQRYFGYSLPFESKVPLPYFFINFPVKLLEGKIRRTFTMKDVLDYYWYMLSLFPGLGYWLRFTAGCFLSTNDLLIHNFRFRLSYMLYRPLGMLKRRMKHAR